MNSLLVVMPSWVGDIVMATPALRALHAQDSTRRIIVTVRPGLESLLAGAPFVDSVETASLRGALGPLSDARRLSTLADTVLLLPNSFRAALFARLTGARRRIGFARDGRRFLLTDRIAPTSSPTPRTTLEEYVDLVEEAFELSIEDRSMHLSTTPEEEAAAASMLDGINEPIVLINPGANRADKRWPPAHFAELADELRKRHSCAILVNGSPAEASLVREIVDRARPGVIDLPERGSTLGALKAVMSRAALLVSNDTGPRHLAAALGTPCVALFGPTDRRWTILPGANERHVVAEPFLTEDRVADRYPKACAIDRISVGDVLHAAEQLLGETGQS